MQDGSEPFEITKDQIRQSNNETLTFVPSDFRMPKGKKPRKRLTMACIKAIVVGGFIAGVCGAFMGWLLLLIPSDGGQAIVAGLIAVVIGVGTGRFIRKITEDDRKTWPMILGIQIVLFGILLGPYICVQNREFGFIPYLFDKPLVKLTAAIFGGFGVVLGFHDRLIGIRLPKIRLGSTEESEPPALAVEQSPTEVRPEDSRVDRSILRKVDVESPDMDHLECPYCHNTLNGGEPLKPCASCGLIHHEACWNENGGCTRYGCPETPKPSHD